MKHHPYLDSTIGTTIVSPYLLRPLRTYAEALAEIEKKKASSNVHAFVIARPNRETISDARPDAA